MFRVAWRTITQPGAGLARTCAVSSRVGAQPGRPRSKVTGGRASTTSSSATGSSGRSSASLNQPWMMPLPARLADGPADVRRVEAGAEPLQQGRDPADLLGGEPRLDAVLHGRQVGGRDLPLDLGGHPVEGAVDAEHRDPLDLGAVLLLHQAGRDRGALAALADPAHPHDGGTRCGRA